MLALLLLLKSSACLAGFSYPLHPELTQPQPLRNNYSSTTAAPASPAAIAETRKTNSRAPASSAQISGEKYIGQSNVAAVKIPQFQRTKKIKIEAYEPPNLHSLSHEKLITFSVNARQMPLPTREYHGAEAAKIAARYADALTKKEYVLKRSLEKPALQEVTKTKIVIDTIVYDQVVQRMDALFDILEHKYALGIGALWELSLNQKQQDIGRDLLFAGLGANRAGWEILSSQLYIDAVENNVAENYFPLLWKELDHFVQERNVAAVIKAAQQSKRKFAPQKGDQANFQMANALLHSNADHQAWADAIGSDALKARLKLEAAITLLEKNQTSDAEAILDDLTKNAPKAMQREAHLALARLYMSQTQPDKALVEYAQLPTQDSNRLDLLEEKAYAQYRSGLYQESLGKSIGMESDYFRFAFAPEAFMLEVLSRKALCDFGGAKVALQNLVNIYGPEQAAIAQWIQSPADPESRYTMLISSHEKAKPFRFERFLLAKPDIVALQSNINARAKEWRDLKFLGTRKYMQPVPGNWQKFLSAYEAKNNKAEHAIVLEIAASAGSEAIGLHKKLSQFFAQAELMKLDVATQASEQYNLQSALNFPARSIASTPTPADKLSWGFQNEVWEDELDDLVAKNPSRCVDKKSIASH